MVRDRGSRSVSAPVDIYVDVPQGSVLGPALFSLYLSDFKNALRNCKYSFYTDDLIIYLDCEPCRLVEAIETINEDVDSIVDWATVNQLLLNKTKTQAIIIGISHYIGTIDFSTLLSIMIMIKKLQGGQIFEGCRDQQFVMEQTC